MPLFLNTINPTPFGVYDADTSFQNDANKMVTFVLRSLGDSSLSVELTNKDIWCQFERATNVFSSLLLEYQAKSNLASLLGAPTGSSGSINYTNIYIKQNLEFLQRQAEPYAESIGLGTDQDSISGSIDLRQGIQDYDIYTELKNENGTPIFNLQPSGSQTKLKIFEVFHKPPVQYIFNSNIASNFVATGLPLESYVPDTRFYVLPLFEDVLRGGMLKESQRIRRSNFSYKISGRKIRIYPMPNNITYAPKLWLRVGFVESVAAGLSGSITNDLFSSGSINDGSLFGISTPANIPFQAVPYNTINAWGKQWIRDFCLALCKELLGLIRGKYKVFPGAAGGQYELNWQELLSQGREDMDKLKDKLVELLESLTYAKLQEQEATKAENLNKQLQLTPIPPTAVLVLR